MPRDYLLHEARRRLELLEAVDDPGTISQLEAIGVAPGWRCLEVGAGGGSIALWLSRRVGPDGGVVATDLDPRHLAALEAPGLEVRRHDVASDPLPAGSFDLVHARSVLMHLAERDEVLEKLVRAVRPGGWILVEEPDSDFDAPDPSSDPADAELYRRVVREIYDFVRERGLDPAYGARLFGRLAGLGLEAVRGEGRLRFYRGGREPRSAHTPAFAEIRDRVVGRGRVSGRDYDAFLALAENPAFAWREALIVSVRGRRPTS